MFSRFSTPTHCPLPPGESILSWSGSKVLPTQEKEAEKRVRLVEPSEMIGLWGNCSDDDVFFCSLVSSQWEAHIFLVCVCVCGGTIVNYLVIHEVWVKKTLRDSRGQIGHLKTLSGTSVTMDILIVVHMLSCRQGCCGASLLKPASLRTACCQKKAMLTLCCSSSLTRDYSEN